MVMIVMFLGVSLLLLASGICVWYSSVHGAPVSTATVTNRSAALPTELWKPVFSIQYRLGNYSESRAGSASGHVKNASLVSKAKGQLDVMNSYGKVNKLQLEREYDSRAEIHAEPVKYICVMDDGSGAYAFSVYPDHPSDLCTNAVILTPEEYSAYRVAALLPSAHVPWGTSPIRPSAPLAPPSTPAPSTDDEITFATAVNFIKKDAKYFEARLAHLMSSDSSLTAKDCMFYEGFRKVHTHLRYYLGNLSHNSIIYQDRLEDLRGIILDVINRFEDLQRPCPILPR